MRNRNLEGAFVYLHSPPKKFKLEHVVGRVLPFREKDNTHHVERLWDSQEGKAHGKVSRYGSPISNWKNTVASGTMVTIIPCNHPDYDRWWAWFIALELGVEMEVPG